jgi:hypothetical protein
MEQPMTITPEMAAKIKAILEEQSAKLDKELPHKSKAEPAPQIPQIEDLSAKLDTVTKMLEAMLMSNKQPETEMVVEEGESAMEMNPADKRMKAMEDYMKACDGRIKALEERLMQTPAQKAMSVQNDLPQLIQEAKSYEQSQPLNGNIMVDNFFRTIAGGR